MNINISYPASTVVDGPKPFTQCQERFNLSNFIRNVHCIMCMKMYREYAVNLE